MRPPTADEVALVVKFFNAERSRLTDKTDDLVELTGDRDALREVIDRAAWTASARAMLNLDEMVTRE